MLSKIAAICYSIIKLIRNFIESFFQDSQKNLSNRFNILDGYRGFCALVVTIHHLVCFFPSGDFEIFLLSGYYIGVYGFFVLSSFLLTYRMSKDFQKSSGIYDLIDVIIKYAIRRFFRIYIPFMIFAISVHHGPSIIKGIYGNNYNTLRNLLKLEPTLGNHLWTIPIEVKYYFVIPLICLVYHLTSKISTKLWPIMIISSIGITYLIYQKYNFPVEDTYIGTSNKLYPKFPIFFSGSIVAFVYFEYENWNSEWKNLFKHRISRYIFCAISYWMAFYGIKNFTPYYNPKIDMYKDHLHPGIKFSYFLFIMLIGAPNDFTRLLGDSFFLKKIGKYSFGVYLWHPMCITYVLGKSYVKRLDTVGSVLILSQLCAILFYFLIENPAMKLGNYIISFINIKYFRIRFQSFFGYEPVKTEIIP